MKKRMALSSLAGALFDLCFVVMQRSNRPRVLRLAKRAAGRETREETTAEG